MESEKSLSQELAAHRNEHIIDLEYTDQLFDNNQEFKDFNKFINLIMANRNIAYIQFSDKVYQEARTNLRLRDQLDAIKHRLIDNIYFFNTFPSDYVHCMLTKLTYNFNEDNKLEILSQLEPNWEVIETETIVKNDNIYHSKIFKNNKYKQLVLVFEGFKFNHLNFASQREIYKITNDDYIQIKESIRKNLDQAVEECKANQLILSFSGYSYGSWFAIQCLYLCQLKYPFMNAKAVVFESSGSLKILKNLCSKSNILVSKEILNNYEIISYLSEPNFFNTSNKHAGNHFVFSTDPDNEIEFFSHLIDDKSKVFSLQNLQNIYIEYKQKLFSIRDSFEKGYTKICDRGYESDSEERLSNNFNDKLKKIKEAYKKFSFYVSGIESLTENRLQEISKQFDPETQRIEHCRQIQDWPCLRPSNEQNTDILNHYNETITYIKQKIEEFKDKTDLSYKIKCDYESSEISKFECALEPKAKMKTTNHYLFQLATKMNHEINSTFRFIRNHLIHLKSLFDLQATPTTYKIRIKDSEIQIETIKRVLERLIYIDKHLQLKFGIINDYKDYDLMSNSRLIEPSNEKLLFDCDYKCENILNDTHYKKRTFLLRFIEERNEINQLLDEAKNDLERKIGENQIFVDEEFAHENASLFNYRNITWVKWLRPNEIKSLVIDRFETNRDLSRPTCIFRGPREADNYQGGLGDCYLIAALTSLTHHTYFLDEIFLLENNPKYQNINLGFYQIKLCIRGRWTVVSIDDRLPCRPDETLFYCNTFSSQIWTSLIEKAYAKANMNYESLRSGYIAEAFSLLTGFASEVYDLKHESTNIVREKIYSKNIWRIIFEASDNNCLMCCSCFIQNDLTSEEYKEKNLPIKHAYTVLKAIELGHHKLMLIKNPHGKKTWSGDWSQRPSKLIKESKWTNSKINEFRERYPDLPIDDFYEKGIFWISFEDFSKYFRDITICDFKEQFYVKRLYDQVFYNTHSENFLAYDLEITQDNTSVYIEIFNSGIPKRYDLMQSDLGFIVLKSSNEFFCHSDFVISSYVSKKLLLTKGVYRIIPISFRFWNAKNKEMNKFNLVIHSSKRFNINANSLEIRHLPEILFKILPKSRLHSARTIIINDLTFVYAYNEKSTNVYRLKTTVTADMTQCKEDKQVVEEVYNSSDFTRPFDKRATKHVFYDIIEPRCKRIILIIVNYAGLKFNHNYREDPKKKYEFGHKKANIEFDQPSGEHNYAKNIDVLHSDIPI